MIEIYDRSNAILVEVPILDTSVRHHALMGENYVRLDFELAENIEFPKGCYIIYEGFRFEIFTDVDPDFNEETGGWKYSIQFEGVEGHLKKYNVFYRGQGFEEAVFALTTTLTSFGNLIAECINHELGSSNWVVKDVPEDLSEITKGISFSGDKLYDALGMIANEFDCEWWIEQNGDLVYICFGKLEFGSEEIFRRGEVVATMPRRSGDNSNYGTRFYVFGSTRNLTSDYGHASQGGVTNHISEIRLRLPDGIPYIDAWEPLAKEDIVEQLVFFEDVFPKNTETVTSVETEERVDDEGNKFTAYIMYVANTPFTPSDIIEGETIRCTFESGPLEGREFELSINTKAFDKKFEIIAVTEGEGSITIPNENLKPEPGNKFILTGVRLPKQRTTEAEQELLKHGKTWAKKNSSDTNVYECPTNPVYCQVNDKNYDLGQKVKLVGDRFGSIGRSSRIQAYEKKLINPYEATYTVGDNTVYSRLGSIETNIKENQYAERIGVVSGVGIYIIRKYDNTAPTDYNVFSALRAMENFHPKGGRKALDFAAGNMNAAGSLTVEKDIQSGGDIQTQKSITAGQDIDAKGNVTAQGNIESGAEIIAKDKFATDNFRKGNISGSGAAIYKDSTGSSVVEADKMIIRKEAVFNELIINQMSFRLGETVFSNGGFECTSVQEENTYYRCYYDNKNGTRYSGIVVGDQARCQRYSPDNKSIIKYFWALVTGVGDDYVDISKTDKDGSGIPAEGDNIVQFGNRTDVARQSAIVIDARDGGSIQVLAKIDSFDLTDKNYIGIGVNPVTGRAYQYVYGDMFCGDRNLDDPEATYITFQQAPGDTKPRMRMNTDVIIGKNSSGLKNLSEWPEVKQDIDTAKEYSDKALDALADIANDDKLTPSEKQEAKREWDIIQGEKPILTAQADTIQLSTADYLNVYNALSAYITPLLADMTTTSTITGSVFNARFKTYYDAKTTLLKNIQYYSSGQFRITTIDATELDPDTYYPVTFTLYNATDYKATFNIGTVLGTSGKPPWATHAQGFSCNCAWESNGNRSGTLPVKRYIHSFAYSFAESTPVGSIGQVTEMSMEYIYVRGGGRYTVRTSGVPFIELHPSGYHWTSGSSSGDLPTRTSVETPVVNLDAAQKTAQEAKDAAASLNTTVASMKDFTDEAFADGIVDRAEAASIEKYINTVNETGSAADAAYGKLYNNPYLGGSAKTDLATKKSAFDAAKVSLLNAISAAIADGKASEAEVRNVNAQYTEFNAAYKDFTRAIEDANQAIQNELKSYSDAAQDAADAAAARVAELEFLKSAFSDMTTEISDGLLLTGFVGVRDSASNIVAGLSGINPYSDLSRYPILFGGATSAKAANDAKFRFYSDGYFALGGDRLVFEPTTSSLTVRGAIYASSGEFRGKVYASGGEFTGKVVATSGEFTGTVHASAGEFTGTITASSGKVGDFVIDNGNLLNTKNSGNIKFTYGESYVVMGNSVDYDGTYGGLIVKARDTQATAVGISIFAWGTPGSIAIDIQRGDLFLGSSSKIHGFATSTKYFTSGSIVLEKQHDYVEYGGSSEGSILLPDGQDGKVVWVKKSGSGNLVVRSRTLGKIIRMGSSLVDRVVINWTTECKFTFIGSTGYWNYANYNN